jgi:hypothetical protein
MSISMSMSGKSEPFERVLIPFDGRPGGLYMLVHLLKQRKDIYLLYITDLHPWNGEREVSTVRNLVACFADYWKAHLKNKVIVGAMNYTRTGMSLELRDRLLQEKCRETAAQYGLGKVILPASFSQSQSQSQSQEQRPMQVQVQVQYIPVPASLTKRLELIDEHMYIYPDTIDVYSSTQDVWKYCIPCHTIEPERFPMEGEGCARCGARCSTCDIFMQTMCDLGSMDDYDTPVSFGLPRRKRKRDRVPDNQLQKRVCVGK